MAQNLGESIVMGPAMTTSPRKPIDPPPFNPSTIKFKWRHDVRAWARVVQRMAAGGCKYAKATLHSLGDTLYLAIDESSRHLLDHAINEGVISLEPSVNETDINAMIEGFIAIIAEDSPTENIKRLVTMMQDIHVCCRQDSESPIAFARRFHGLASCYMNNSDSSNAARDGQLFAMILLENAKLPESTSNHIILQLISDSITKPANPLFDKISITKRKLASIMEILENSTNRVEHDTTSTPATQSAITNVKTHLRKIIDDDAKQRAEKNTPNITLDAAVRAVSEVSIAPVANFTGNHYGSMLGKRTGVRFDRDNNIKRRIPPGEGPKAYTICKACGQKGHWWKDNPDCVAIMKKRFALESQSNVQNPSEQRETQKTPNNAGQNQEKSDKDGSNQSTEIPEVKSFFRR